MNEEKDKIVKLFALYNGWLSGWLAKEHEAMEWLYDRKFSLESVAKHHVDKNYYYLDTKEYLRVDFLQSFFRRFAQIEMISLPEIGFSKESPMVPPRIIEKTKYEDAWKYHIQKMVLLGDQKLDYVQQRLNYLFEFVPESLAKDWEKFQKEKHKRILAKMI